MGPTARRESQSTVPAPPFGSSVVTTRSRTPEVLLKKVLERLPPHTLPGDAWVRPAAD